MLILDIIEKIQKKPLYYRKRVLLLSTTVITGAIAVIWFVSFDFNLNPVDPESVAEEFRPLSEIKASFISFVGVAKKIGTEAMGSFSSQNGGNSQDELATSSSDTFKN